MINYNQEGDCMYINGENKKNEFVKHLDGKKFKDLIPNLKRFIKSIYADVEENSVITCRYVNNGKVDIEIICMNRLTRIMIKSGSNSLIHMEQLCSFIDFLKEINIDDKIIRFMSGYFDEEDIKKCYDADFTAINMSEKIKLINEVLTQEEFIDLILERILCYDYYHKKIHYLYYGNVLTGICIKAEELKELMKIKKQTISNHIIIGKIHLYNFNINIFSNNKEVDKYKCLFKVNNLYSYLSH